MVILFYFVCAFAFVCGAFLYNELYDEVFIVNQLQAPERDLQPNVVDGCDMVIAYALMDLVEIKKSGANLSVDALNNLNAIALVARSMRGELQ
jgi:hypothetical protein